MKNHSDKSRQSRVAAPEPKGHKHEMSTLQKTRDYSKFALMKGQRPIDPSSSECKALKNSMQEYGWLPAFPLMVRYDKESGKLLIVDGQHRYAMGKELGLPVFYVVDETEIDVTKVNSAQRKWTVSDYAQRWAAEGNEHYQFLIDYHQKYGISLTVSAGVLAGTIRFSNIAKSFYDGRFEITNEDLAIRFGETASQMMAVSKFAKNASFLTALWGCYFVDYFQEDRLVSSLQRRPTLLTSCGDRDSYLQAIEEIYNFARKTRVPLRFDAEEAMRQRNPFLSGNRQQA